jgi:hypothetical protein
VRYLPLPKTPGGAILARQPPEVRGMSVYVSVTEICRLIQIGEVTRNRLEGPPCAPNPVREAIGPHALRRAISDCFATRRTKEVDSVMQNCSAAIWMGRPLILIAAQHAELTVLQITGSDPLAVVT